MGCYKNGIYHEDDFKPELWEWCPRRQFNHKDKQYYCMINYTSSGICNATTYDEARDCYEEC